MSCMGRNTTTASSERHKTIDHQNPIGETENVAPLHAARKGLLKAVWQASFAPRFSSRPIDMEDYFSRESFANNHQLKRSTIQNLTSFVEESGQKSGIDEGKSSKENSIDMDQSMGHSIIETKNLTSSEQEFLENLLQSDDLDSIRMASKRLADQNMFPPPIHNSEKDDRRTISLGSMKRRESKLQQELFRLHQSTSMKPSAVLRQMSAQSTGNEESPSDRKSRAKRATASTPLIPQLQQSNSILTTQSQEKGKISKIPPIPPPLPKSSSKLLQPTNSILASSNQSSSTSEQVDDTASVTQNTASTPLIPPLHQSNSILASRSKGEALKTSLNSTKPVKEEEYNAGSWDMEDSDTDEPETKSSCETKPVVASRPPKLNSDHWNPPIEDVNSWIDGNQGTEVDDKGDIIGKTKPLQSPTSNPFRILGTSASDISAHPHVLTPPLMEGLQEFMPDSLQECHFWLKYSLVRDGPYDHRTPSHPPLWDLVRHCRGSKNTILAMETSDGHVLGAFCSQPWQFQDDAYWGTHDSYIWKLRRSRGEECTSIMEQVVMESQIDVFPVTNQNGKIQRCSLEDGIILGEGELMELSQRGEHYGHAIQLAPSLTEAWTSTSETFGSPCLVPSDSRGEHIQLANVELWALTPHTSIESAITAEMNQLFLPEDESSASDKNLNLFEILVGGPV